MFCQDWDFRQSKTIKSFACNKTGTMNWQTDFKMFFTNGDTEPVASPCGMCRQVISEFASKSTKIYLANLSGIKKEFLFTELLPEAFSL